MKAFLEAYDFRELIQKGIAKYNKIWICQSLPKIANNPNLVA
jgi:hypothetical protein